MTLTIGGVEIGGTNPCRFVAEISNNHSGSLSRAKELIYRAKEIGADFVKFQCYTPDELVALRGDGPAPEPWGAQGWTMRALYEKAQTPHAWFPELADFCRHIGMPWFSSVFGAESLALLESLGCPTYKIARLDNRSEALALAIAATNKPTVISEAVAYEAEGICDARLYCPPGYPQTDFAFGRGMWIGDYEERPDWLGFSFHGTDYTPCIVAAALGAKLIEAHMQLDDELSELEANVSLTTTQFGQMIRDVRQVEGMFT